MSRIERTVLGIIVGRVEVGEADLVVHLLTQQGRCSVFVAAGRKSRRRFGGTLELFTTIQAELGKQRHSGLSPLLGSEYRVGRRALANDLECFALSSFGCELSERLAPEGAPTELMEHLEQLLDTLLLHPASLVLRRVFELGVLGALGSQPQLTGCPVCGRTGWHLDLVHGGVFCGAHQQAATRIGPKTLAWLHHVTQHGLVDVLGPLTAEEAVRAAKAVGRSLDRVWSRLVERPLRSMSLLASLGL
ncbi:MAG: DNA repair protein RecO [Myxococcales bacterium]|nr:DNA repair protein RecO [Myxococcales bacterium]